MSKVSETPLQYDPNFPTAIWRNDVYVGSTNTETGGKMENRDELARLIVERFNMGIASIAKIDD